MKQRGSVALYLLFSIVIAIAVGFGVYRWMHEHPEMFESKDDGSATASPSKEKPTKAAVKAPDPEVAEVPEAVPPPSPKETPGPTPAMLAAERAQDPIVDPTSDASPVFGVPGIEGGIERGAVERRFKPRATRLQLCFDEASQDSGLLRVTMEVDPKGKVSHVSLNAGWSNSFEACVASAVDFNFSATKDGKPAAIVQPIAFQQR